MSEERALLAESAREFLDRWSPSAAVRGVLPSASGFDHQVWAKMTELGWAALLVPEAHGGFGASLADAAVIASELGAHTTPAPFLSSAVLATSALALADPAGSADLLKQLAEGSTLATVAIGEMIHTQALGTSGVTASPDGKRLRLRGTCDYVPDLAAAEHVVVAARTPDGAAVLALVRAGAPGMARADVELMDLTRRAGRLTFDDAEVDAAAVLARGDAAEETVDAVRMRGKVVLAADSVGAATRALDLAVAYAKQRVQFDRPIGSFQAIKHKLANMFALAEVAGAGVEQAAELADTAPASRLVASAASYALDAAVQVIGDSIQVHGGIGFTWEHDCHLLLKRALLNEAMLGEVAALRERIAAELLD
jgi:alkylation response protein AidB-like acyl-CoA dehydrogenase